MSRNRDGSTNGSFTELEMEGMEGFLFLLTPFLLPLSFHQKMQNQRKLRVVVIFILNRVKQLLSTGAIKHMFTNI